jgi:hypothetical protein
MEMMPDFVKNRNGYIGEAPTHRATSHEVLTELFVTLVILHKVIGQEQTRFSVQHRERPIFGTGTNYVFSCHDTCELADSLKSGHWFIPPFL